MTNMNTTNTMATTKKETNFNKEKVMDFLSTARYFAPILASAGWIIGFSLGHMVFFDFIGIIFVIIGLVSAVTVCPIKFLKFAFTCGKKGFGIARLFIPVYGLADIFGGLFGFTTGAFLGLMVTIFAPALFTIKKYREIC